MRQFVFILGLTISSMAVHAESLTPCDSNCFRNKQACNSKNGHSFNDCDKDLFSCKASCRSGNSHAAYQEPAALKVSFSPVLDFVE